MKRRPVPILLTALLACLPPLAQAQQPAAGKAPADPFAGDPPPAQTANGGDPFVKGDPFAADPNAADNGVKEGLIRLEYFSLPLSTGRKVMKQFPRQNDLYAWLGAELENPKSEVKLERLSLLKIRGGQRSKLEEIDELPYPTEFDPPQIPQSVGIGTTVLPPASVNVTNTAPAPVPPKPVPPKPTPVPPPAPGTTPPPAPAPAPGVKGEAGSPGPAGPSTLTTPGAVPATRSFSPWPYTTTTPSSFTFRNTGWTFEVEMTFGEDGKTVDLNVAPEFVKFTGMEFVDKAGEISQPGFQSGKIHCTVLTLTGKPTLVGTISPPVGTGAPHGNTADRVWLLFLTVNRSR